MTTRKKITQTILGLLICYVTVIYIPQGIKLFFKAEGEVSKFLIYAFCQIGLCLSLLFYVLKVEKRSLASIGFKPFIGERDVKWGLIGFGLAGISFAITGPLLESFGFESTRDGVIKLAKYSIWMRIGIAVIAGFTEEILFRTYPIERLNEYQSLLIAKHFTAVNQLADPFGLRADQLCQGPFLIRKAGLQQLSGTANA